MILLLRWLIGQLLLKPRGLQLQGVFVFLEEARRLPPLFLQVHALHLCWQRSDLMSELLHALLHGPLQHLKLLIYVSRRSFHLEVVKLIVHHRNVVSAVPDHCLVLVLQFDCGHFDSVVLRVIKEPLVASNGDRSKLIIVPLL